MTRHAHRLGVIWLFLLGCSPVLLAASQGDAQVVTTGSLFEEMTDMVRLASFPRPAFRTVQFSSFDRRSDVPGGPNWFANSDGFGGEPIPNFEKVLKAPNAEGVGEYLVADVAGPGAIVRLWTAAISGQVRVTIDNAETPFYEGPADTFFHRPYDHFSQMQEIDRDRFDRTVYQRDASYAPIPFARHLRVVWTGNVKQIHFYELQVRLYDEDASVVSFRASDIHDSREMIDRVTLSLADPDRNIEARSQKETELFDLSLGPDEQKPVVRLEGSQAIEQLSLKLTGKDLDKALRQTVLHVYCDDYPWAQVQSPVGDFFGAAPGVNPYQSLPFTVQPDGTMVCRFVMPFAKSCRVELFNGGEQTVRVQGSVLAMPFDWDDHAMHFRARWRVDHDLIASNRAVQDLPFLLAQGKGVYVGTGVYLMNPCPIPTPYGNWWGEGDEKIFVDDDEVPSIFGTGSEDYFNYSWSSPDIFIFPFCGQPRNDGPGNRGFVTNYRWHILDRLAFQHSMRFYMELYSHERTPGMSYARIGYHYARPGIMDDHQALMPADLRLLVLPENWQPAARMGAGNSVFFTAEDIAVDTRMTRLEQGRLWAGGQLLVWTPKKTGDTMSFQIPVDSAGRKQIHVALAMTPQAGRIALWVDGKSLAEVDLYRPHRTLLRTIALEPLELTQGNHTLTLELTHPPQDAAEAQIGIDYVGVQKK
ncbi:MAG: DUF2961 domain-containing protein [Phycisphaerae bacterium]|nr:DUF2961 domain-containing protein [Phycisphaerae bacterium]